MKKIVSLFAALFTTSASAEPALPDLLAALEVQLQKKRPDLVATLRPPLTEEDIVALEHKYETSLPSQVRMLYKWHDGQDLEKFSVFVENMQFQPLESALLTKVDLDSMIGYDFELENWWHPAWLPLFQNGGGDYIVVDAAGIHTGNKGQLLTVYHDWEHRPINAPNLLVFSQAVLAYYKTTPIEDMDEFYLLENHLPETALSFDASGNAKPLK
ncbi:SMI1/KNR4 family protein [Ahrensia kielensis]|uniref:SMI1/KNR4 family protein n=1 Tax=Ahrensia kielensis TaxID=76980 RepID=UPI000368418C|nr:SMI1/KNR4 family protein [Ahrensia kielensis]